MPSQFTISPELGIAAAAAALLLGIVLFFADKILKKEEKNEPEPINSIPPV